MAVMPIDPLELPKFKHKNRVPKDQQDSKIPPCISNWKSPKGFTIPLNRRLAADGRGLQEVALGMALASIGRGGEVMYDQRLFNQEKGMDLGYATDDQYNVYDKGLFTAQPTLYRPKKDKDGDMYGGVKERLEKIMKTDRFKPGKAFVGTSEKTGPIDRPVEFEKEEEEADPFGTMKASAGSSMRDGHEGLV